MLELSKRTAEIIAENRRNLESGAKIGSNKWWRRIDKLSQRNKRPRVILNKIIEELNVYFGELCHADNYEEPLVVPIDETTAKPPQLNDPASRALSLDEY